MEVAMLYDEEGKVKRMREHGPQSVFGVFGTYMVIYKSPSEAHESQGSSKVICGDLKVREKGGVNAVLFARQRPRNSYKHDDMTMLLFETQLNGRRLASFDFHPCKCNPWADMFLVSSRLACHRLEVCALAVNLCRQRVES